MATANRFMKAIKDGDVASVRRLAANGLNIYSDNTFAGLAVMGGRPEVIKCLHELRSPMQGDKVLPECALYAETKASGIGDPGVVISVLAALRDVGVDLGARLPSHPTVLCLLLDDNVLARKCPANKGCRGANARRKPSTVSVMETDGLKTIKTWWSLEARLEVARWLLEAGVDPEAGYPIDKLAA